MADHINIHCPDYGDRWATRLHILKLEAEIKNLQAERDQYRNDLEAIFTRIERGDEVWLYPSKGERVSVIRKPDAPQSPPIPPVAAKEGD